MKQMMMAMWMMIGCGAQAAATNDATEDVADALAESDGTWQELNTQQQQAILAQQQVRVDSANPNVWATTYYQWIKHDAATTTPRGAAAVYWDLPGQVSYQPGLRFFDIEAGRGTAAVRAIVGTSYPNPQNGQPVETSYPQENTLTRLGQSAYASAWHSTDPDQPFTPLTPVMTGEIRFSSFPGDGGGALLRFRVVLVPLPALLGDAATKEFALSSFAATVEAHVTRMRQGATAWQLARLKEALD